MLGFEQMLPSEQTRPATARDRLTANLCSVLVWGKQTCGTKCVLPSGRSIMDVHQGFTRRS
jgi:hypothetical protein